MNVIKDNQVDLHSDVMKEGSTGFCKDTASAAKCHVTPTKNALPPLSPPTPNYPPSPNYPPPSPPSPPLPRVPFLCEKKASPTYEDSLQLPHYKEDGTLILQTEGVPKGPHHACGDVSSYKTCTLCFEPHAHAHNTPRGQSGIVNIDKSLLEETDVEQARALQPHATEVAEPPVSQSSIRLPKKQKYVYSKWASRKSDHKVVLKLSPKISRIRSEARNALHPHITPTNKPKSPLLPRPSHHYTTELKVSLDVDASKVIKDVQDKNKVFKYP